MLLPSRIRKVTEFWRKDWLDLQKKYCQPIEVRCEGSCSLGSALAYRKTLNLVVAEALVSRVVILMELFLDRELEVIGQSADWLFFL
jgi:hypothetical protein